MNFLINAMAVALSSPIWANKEVQWIRGVVVVGGEGGGERGEAGTHLTFDRPQVGVSAEDKHRGSGL